MTEYSEGTRRDIYAKITHALRRDPRQVGSHSLFNQALTAGLIEIYMSVDNDGFTDQVKRGGGRYPAAGWMLDNQVLRQEITNADTLAQAVRETDPVRHGKERDRYLTDNEVEALARLDDHAALYVLDQIARDDDWVRDQALDSIECAHAERYLEMLDDAEIQRRMQDLPDLTHPNDPNANPPSECPVCGYDALLTSGCDDYGYGFGSGSCFVCSYFRSYEAADHQGWMMEMTRLMDRGN